jgi:hypothetical protein
MKTVSSLLIFAATVVPTSATAHDGHGIPSTMHFHASDAWGFAMLAAVAVGVFFLARKK